MCRRDYGSQTALPWHRSLGENITRVDSLCWVISAKLFPAIAAPSYYPDQHSSSFVVCMPLESLGLSSFQEPGKAPTPWLTMDSLHNVCSLCFHILSLGSHTASHTLLTTGTQTQVQQAYVLADRGRGRTEKRIGDNQLKQCFNSTNTHKAPFCVQGVAGYWGCDKIQDIHGPVG